ncbi:MAG TPA: hypothetical protein VHG09_13460 [Longimicrobiales bacterium]|nr:hypothetical protein [Longimicrobiales bacterium]
MNVLRPRLRSWLLVAAIVVILVLGFRGVRSMMNDSPHAELRARISALRARADSCQWAVDGRAAELRAYDSRLDSMRERVRELEALDRRGVPVDSYRVYMETFNRYNDSAAAWPPIEDSVRALNDRCRAIAERHNVLADSLRQLVFPIPE